MPERDLLCPSCNVPMLLRETTKYQYPKGGNRKFLGCSNFPSCDVIIGAHPDGTPMGIPGDKATRVARIKVHYTFDAAWKARGLTRKQGYLWLQDLTGLSELDAHISKFTEEQCHELTERLRLAEAIREIQAEVSA